MSKVSFLFWNLNRRPLADHVAALAIDNDVDVLMLAENAISLFDLLNRLNAGRSSMFSLFAHSTSSVTVLARFPLGSMHRVLDTSRLSIRRLVPPIGKDVILATAHLPSKLHRSGDDQMLDCTALVRYIEQAEREIGHSRTIVCGDFNMDPFEAGMIGAAGFHAVMSRKVASAGQRTVSGEPRRFFYNPMWSFFGDASAGPPGTYYYSSGRQITYFWHMFDQILIRPELLPDFDNRDLTILTSAGGRDLMSATGIPNAAAGSDHLPIGFRLSL